MNDDASIEEMVDFLVSLRAGLEAKGYQVPSLADLCLIVRDYLIENGIEIDDNDIEEIYNEITKREGALINHTKFSHAVNKFSKFKIIEVKHKKKNKEIRVSDGFARGFMKALGGALLAIIPHPVTIGIGIGLMVDGVKDMVEHAGDPPSEESAEDKMKNLPHPLTE